MYCRNSLSDVVRVVAEYRDHLAPSGFILKVVLNELVKQGRPQEELDVVLKALNERPTLSPVDVIDIEQKVYLNNQRMDKVREVMEVSGCGCKYMYSLFENSTVTVAFLFFRGTAMK